MKIRQGTGAGNRSALKLLGFIRKRWVCAILMLLVPAIPGWAENSHQLAPAGMGLHWVSDPALLDQKRGIAYTNQYLGYKLFLSSVPSIQLIKFSLSGATRSIDDKVLTVPVTYESAVQPNTFYVHETLDIFHPQAPAGQGPAAGLSYSEYWSIYRKTLTTSRRGSNLVGSEDGPAAQAETLQVALHTILSLGLVQLERDTLVWTGENQFEWSSASFGKFRGRVDEGDGFRPSVVSYSCDSRPDTQWRVDLQYEESDQRPKWAPAKLIWRATKAGRQLAIETNSIEVLRLGHRILGPDGLTPAEITNGLDQALAPTVVVKYTNGVGYALVDGRDLMVGSDGEGLASQLMATKPRSARRAWILVAIAGLALLGVVLYQTFLLTRKRRSVSHT